MHYRHWVRRNRGKNLKCAFRLKKNGFKVNCYVKSGIKCMNVLCNNVNVDEMRSVYWGWHGGYFRKSELIAV